MTRLHKSRGPRLSLKSPWPKTIDSGREKRSIPNCDKKKKKKTSGAPATVKVLRIFSGAKLRLFCSSPPIHSLLTTASAGLNRVHQIILWHGSQPAFCDSVKGTWNLPQVTDPYHWEHHIVFSFWNQNFVGQVCTCQTGNLTLANLYSFWVKKQQPEQEASVKIYVQV